MVRGIQLTLQVKTCSFHERYVMAKKRFYNGAKKTIEMQQSGPGMIKDDPNAPAFLPEKEIYMDYPEVGLHGGSLDDSLVTSDSQMRDDLKGTKYGKTNPKKY